MTNDLHTLPEDCVYAFCPAYEPADQPQRIRIVFDGVPGFVPTALDARRGRRQASLKPRPRPTRRGPRVDTEAGPRLIDPAPQPPALLHPRHPRTVQATLCAGQHEGADRGVRASIPRT